MTDYYDELDVGNEPARLDGWRHRTEQWLRFETVFRGLEPPDDAVIVDLGSGTGRLRAYLGDEFDGEYLGVDLREEALRRGRCDCPDAQFLRADWADEAVDERGPFDFAVAIGTMVDGREDVDRRQLLARLVGRLDELGRRGWALVVLDQDRLEADPIRRLDPALRGARRGELQRLADRRNLEVAVAGEVLPSDLFALTKRGSRPEQILERLEGDRPHEALIERLDRQWSDFDAADETRLWLVSGRIERARACLEQVPDDHPDRVMLASRIRQATASAR